LSCLSNDKDTQESSGDFEPLSPSLINTDDHRPRVFSTDNSVHSATQSINTFKMMNSPDITSKSQPQLTILSKSPKYEPVDLDDKKKSGTITWDFSKLKISEELPKFSLNDNKKLLPRADLSLSKLESNTETICNLKKQDSESKYTGRCKAWYSEKGFGFVHCNQDSKDYFCHFTSIIKQGFRSLQEGDIVGFDLSDNIRKVGSKMCTNVVLV